MSAYGAITVANETVNLLPPTTWDLPQPAPGKPATPFRRLVLHHLRLDSARALPSGPSLLDYTHGIFAAEIEAGRTYPQETDALVDDSDARGHGSSSAISTHTYTRAAFEAYFWAADVIVAIGQKDDHDAGLVRDGDVQARAQVGSRSGDLRAGLAGSSLEDALVGFYYVKPNYPGRSSHVSTTYYLPTFHHFPPTTRKKKKTDLQCRVYYSPSSPRIRIRNDFGKIIFALW